MSTVEKADKERGGRHPSEPSNPKIVDVTLFDMIGQYLACQPLEEYREYKCRRCSKEFTFHDRFPPNSPYNRYAYTVCNKCYRQLLLTGTSEGRATVEAVLNSHDPTTKVKTYTHAEFNRFVTAGAYGKHLERVRSLVIAWAKSIVAWLEPGSSVSPQSLYVYSEPGKHGSGCGNGKSFLAWASYRYVARRAPRFLQGSEIVPSDIGFHCVFVDIWGEVEKFLQRRREQQRPWYRFYRKGSHEEVDFDGWINYLAHRGVLFMDDVGCGSPNGMMPDVCETIFDIRASLQLPTFVTSNYSPERLAERIGARAASRAVRVNCQVVEMRAPDFWMTGAGR